MAKLSKTQYDALLKKYGDNQGVIDRVKKQYGENSEQYKGVNSYIQLNTPKQAFVGRDIARKIGLTEADQQEYKDTGSYSTRAQALIDKYKAGGRVPLTDTTSTSTSDTIENKTYSITPDEEKQILETQKSYYQEYYDTKRRELKQDYQANLDEINRLTQYVNTDYANQLKDLNTTFARSMNKATNTYGQRGLLGSGIQRSQVTDTTSDYIGNQNVLAENKQRKITSYENQQKQLETTYGRNLNEINETQQAQAYYDTISEIQNRANEFYRNLGQEEKKISSYSLQKPTMPTSAYNSSEVLNKNLKIK